MSSIMSVSFQLRAVPGGLRSGRRSGLDLAWRGGLALEGLSRQVERATHPRQLGCLFIVESYEQALILEPHVREIAVDLRKAVVGDAHLGVGQLGETASGVD